MQTDPALKSNSKPRRETTERKSDADKAASDHKR